MRYALTVLISLLCLFGASVRADTPPRVFVDTLEYIGPTLMVDGKVYVDAEKFSRAMGWMVKKSDRGMSIGLNSAPDPAGGVTINGEAYTGPSQTSSGSLYVPLEDLATFLHGSLQAVPQYHVLKATIPGMPTEAARHPVIRKMVEVKTTARPQPKGSTQPRRPRPSGSPSESAPPGF